MDFYSAVSLKAVGCPYRERGGCPSNNSRLLIIVSCFLAVYQF